MLLETGVGSTAYDELTAARGRPKLRAFTPVKLPR